MTAEEDATLYILICLALLNQTYTRTMAYATIYLVYNCDGLGFKAENQIIFGTVYWYLNKSTYRMRYRCVEGNVVFYPVVDPLREKYKINILISTVYETIYKS